MKSIRSWGCWEWRMYLVPLIAPLIMIAVISTCAGITVDQHQIPRNQTVPLIIDTGVKYPEYVIFLCGTQFAAIILAFATIAIKKELHEKVIHELKEWKHQRKCILINKFCLLSGILSAIGLSVLGIVSLGISFWTHAVFALIFFTFNFFQMELVTCLFVVFMYRRWKTKQPLFGPIHSGYEYETSKLNVTSNQSNSLSQGYFWAKFCTGWKITCSIFCFVSVPVTGPIVVFIYRKGNFSLSDPLYFDSVAYCQYIYVTFALFWFSSFAYDLMYTKLGIIHSNDRRYLGSLWLSEDTTVNRSSTEHSSKV